ncbi:hypothetical protein LOD99_613 [Oopsacas minuta]|uniref:Uncharacterized protein n=1 Tax=Oopsacas minuta TaxID=111878 RepID=A0AAV7KA18_9METZ|nr:hypothetical protein LOD99_613 [Oopsacas minuta]
MSCSLKKYQEIHQLFQVRIRKMDPLDVEQFINISDDQGMQCIHWAMLFKDDDVIKFLLLAGSDINSQSDNGLTPLHLSMLNIHNLVEFQNFKEDKFFSHYSGFQIVSRDRNKLKFNVTSIIPSNLHKEPDLSLKEKFGFNPICVANILRSNSKSRILLQSTSVSPEVAIDYQLTSLNTDLTFTSNKILSKAIRRVLSTQVKHGIPSRNAAFIRQTEPQNVNDVINIIDSNNLLMYIWDITIGFPNPILTLFVLLDAQRFGQLREDLKFKAIIESIPPLVNRKDFNWVSAKKHLVLTKYVHLNFSRYISCIELKLQLSCLLDYAEYILVFVATKFTFVNFGATKEVLDSLLYWSIGLLILIWTKYSSVLHIDPDFSIHIKKVINFLQEFALKFNLSIYHMILSNGNALINHENGVSFLLDNDFNCNVRAEEANGNSVLHFAYNKLDIQACMLLLKHGAYPLAVNRFNVSFIDEVVKCPTVLPFSIRKKTRIKQSNEFIKIISKDPQLKSIWVNFSQLPYKLLTLAAQCIVTNNIPYTVLTNKIVAFIELHDPKKFESHQKPMK